MENETNTSGATSPEAPADVAPPWKLRAGIASALAIVSAVAIIAPQLVGIKDTLTVSKLERVNVLAAEDYIGVDSVETCALAGIDADVKLFASGLFVRVRTATGSQSQFFPADGLDAYLAAKEVRASIALIAVASAKATAIKAATKGTRLCRETLVELLGAKARMRCTYPNECVEEYLVELATGEIAERLSPPCIKPPKIGG